MRILLTFIVGLLQVAAQVTFTNKKSIRDYMYENDHKASYTWFMPTSPTQNRQGYPGDVIVLGFTTDERFAFSVEQAEGAE